MVRIDLPKAAEQTRNRVPHHPQKHTPPAVFQLRMDIAAPDRNRLFIVSIPRSGSTVLTTMLDQYDDVLSPPESYFPVLLDTLSDPILKDKTRISGLFIGSCLDGSPLSVAELCASIHSDTRQGILHDIESAIARKFGRSADSIRCVVWKYTRFVGNCPDLGKYSGRMVVLRRDPLNVFESQFRVDFGSKNRNACRFALFESSYTEAFHTYPASGTIRIHYKELPDSVPLLLQAMGSRSSLRDERSSGVGDYSGKNPWHYGINKPFKNNDSSKLANLSGAQKLTYRITSGILKTLPFIGRWARKVADARETEAVSARADVAISSAS